MILITVRDLTIADDLVAGLALDVTESNALGIVQNTSKRISESAN